MSSDLRTYQRRQTTRQSGYHTCEETTGGECIIAYCDKFKCKNEINKFNFNRKKIPVNQLFGKNITILAFGGYIQASNKIKIEYKFTYMYDNKNYSIESNKTQTIDKNVLSCFGSHITIDINPNTNIYNANIEMCIICPKNTIINFIQVDFDIIPSEKLNDSKSEIIFNQKTEMHIPTIYFFSHNFPITKYLKENLEFEKGNRVILKSCNRCGRFLPINIDDEQKTISFSLHCKKNAPCKHSTFRGYEIKNIDELTKKDLKGLTVEDNKIISYYGHQLECKACKKFFVNAPLNPQRNPQQFKEDGLRRRALEDLVNSLLSTNLIHFEFEIKTKKEFSKYIWEKFGKKCFKCGKNSKELALKDMALDHTMPLAYLYRLDETATCLCSSHNSQKSDSFPVDYYTPSELKELSIITGIPYKEIKKKEINKKVLNLLLEKIVWFYDIYLMKKDYQKIRDGIKTSDKIQAALNRVIGDKNMLINEYKKITGKYPVSITIN